MADDVSATGPQSGGGTAAGTTADILRNQLLSQLVTSTSNLNIAIQAAVGGGGGGGGGVNRIINGAMMVSQENGATAGTTSSYFPVDQFQTELITTGAYTVAQVNSTTPAGSPNRIRLTVTTADTSIAAGELVGFQTSIEGFNVADLQFGTNNAKTVTLSFGVRAPAGTYSAAIRNGAANRSYVADFTIAAGEANTDVVKSVTVPGDIAGTWAKDNTQGLSVFWTVAAGTTFQAPVGSWSTGNFVGSPNTSNFMGAAGNVFELFDVGLYAGKVAPAFQVPDYTNELILCQRYFEKIGMTMCILPGSFENTSWYKVTKRASPTITALNSTNGATVLTVVFSPLDGMRQNSNPSVAIDSQFSINARL